jgi:hypothetical protein
MTTKGQKEGVTGTSLSKSQQLLALPFADDQPVVSNTEDNLQKAAQKVNQAIIEHGLNMSVQKTKSMAFKGQEPFRSEISIDNKIIEVSSFKYLGNLISHEKEVDIDNKLSKYRNITGTINIVFRALKTLRKTTIKLNNTQTLPALLYRSENWTAKATDARTAAAELKYMKRAAGYTWTDCKTNTETAKELNIAPVLDKIQSYKGNWIQHVNRTPCNRLPTTRKNCTPKAEGTREDHCRDLSTSVI